MASPNSRHDCWYALLGCHCHSCLQYDLSQLQIRLWVCPPKLSLSQLLTEWPVPAPNTTVRLSSQVVIASVGSITCACLSRQLVLSLFVTSWPNPAPDTSVVPSSLAVTVTVGYIIASPSSRHNCRSFLLSYHCHSWLHHGQSPL